MAKKKLVAQIKLQVPCREATPAPPVGPALGPHGVSAPQFVQQFNEVTKNYEPGLTIPVVISVFGTVRLRLSPKPRPQLFLSRRPSSWRRLGGAQSRTRLERSRGLRWKRLQNTKMPDLNANDRRGG